MRKSVIIVILLALFLLALLLFTSQWRSKPYEVSALGNKGLELVLNEDNIKAISADKYKTYSISQFDFRILSIDAVLFPYLNGHYQLPYSNDARSELTNIFQNKVEEIETMIVLPKWDDRVSENLEANNNYLLLLPNVNWVMSTLDYDDIRVNRVLNSFTREEVKTYGGDRGEIELYNAQYFERGSIPDECEELLGIKAGALLISCYGDYEAYFLSDPDLLNSHGLSLGKNREVAISMIKDILANSDATSVFLDSNEKLFSNQMSGDGKEVEKKAYKRDASDFARLFEYPLSTIWAAILMITIICLWRGAFRFGPALKEANGNIEISKMAAVNAMARLLRLSGNDGQMVAQFVQNSLLDRAVRAFGESGGNQAGVDRLIKRLGQRDKVLAKKFAALAHSLTVHGPTMKRHELYKNLEDFRELLRRVDLESR
ncbi:hypothetical protein N5853_05085 [Bartonella sp. HY329]|uniref:hypothetical protein n=1 Tax=unclassified Bartonella TaxID=2645622 RepID=UPI0021C97D18|nr:MULTISPECIES: hypothetical protein [unclassified Bartonella]UXM95998.1 hypothetical protein N5853_05085 [Bartonella sp. HY329]UXN10323.1 hypothetical protein N5852_05095 [Bartonella sp. HY328]